MLKIMVGQIDLLAPAFRFLAQLFSSAKNRNEKQRTPLTRGSLIMNEFLRQIESQR